MTKHIKIKTAEKDHGFLKDIKLDGPDYTDTCLQLMLFDRQ